MPVPISALRAYDGSGGARLSFQPMDAMIGLGECEMVFYGKPRGPVHPWTPAPRRLFSTYSCRAQGCRSEA